MRFWDTSALVPLVVDEPATKQVRALADQDSSIIVWWGTRTECVSALARRRREGQLSAAEENLARRALWVLAGEWSEISPSEQVRRRAERLVALHPLRSADALQLAAALLWSRGDTAEHSVVCFDERLKEAAAREGFVVLPD